MLFQDDGLFDEEVSTNFLNTVPSLVKNEDNYELMNPFSKMEIVDVIEAKYYSLIQYYSPEHLEYSISHKESVY